MESSSSAIVDFGRFCTGFLVVMGVGMGFPSVVLMVAHKFIIDGC